MATYDALNSYYTNLMRVAVNRIPAADAARITTLAGRVDANTLSFGAATQELAKLAINTTSVATLSYQFFTGLIPRDQGIDYLVSPTGENANNLNAAYYQNFNLENRFINFAVNLGKLGEGQAKFAADYGGLSLTQALVKAYTQIFGAAPSAEKTVSLLADLVPNGAGGTYTRGEYFAFYGKDGIDGIGTKAAMVGWLLAQAAKEDIGVYAKANDALLIDMAVDKLAAYQTDLLESYGVPPATTAGQTVSVQPNQSLTIDIVQGNAQDDIVTAPNGLNAGQWISTAAGKDTVTVTGELGGYIATGAGNDVINVGVLNPSVVIIGGALTGTILAGAGDDAITVGRLRNGAVIDGGAGEDRATIAINEELISLTEPPVIRNVEHLVVSDMQLQFGMQLSGWDMKTIKGLTDLYTTSTHGFTATNIENGVEIGVRNVNSGAFNFGYATSLVFTGPASTTVYASSAHLHLDNVGTTLAPGVAAPTVKVDALNGPLYVHVDSDSNLSRLTTGDLLSAPVKVLGPGRLTVGFERNTTSLDASASTGGVNVTRFGSPSLTGQEYNAALSAKADLIAVDLQGQAKTTLTLGAGIDTVSLYQDGFNAPRFANMQVTDGKVTTMATITDFVKGTDLIELGPAIATVTVDMTRYITNPASLEAALQVISSNLAANGTGVFEYNGDTYIYHQDATVGANSGDGLLKLVGVTGLAVVTGVGVIGDIHYG
jgi:hypothetical protein